MIGWRDRLALWCLAKLTPDGVASQNVPLQLDFGPGRSTKDDPRLCMYVKVKGSGQLVMGLVFHPDDVLPLFAEAVDSVERYFAEQT